MCVISNILLPLLLLQRKFGRNKGKLFMVFHKLGGFYVVQLLGGIAGN